jgi:hypothetical protein
MHCKDPTLIANLCPALKKIAEAELQRGNVITETSTTWGFSGGVTVWFMRQFAPHQVTDTRIVYKRLADPHDGFAEYVCESEKQILICGLST